MKKLEIEFQGYNNVLKTMTINGKSVRVKKSKNASRICEIETDKDTAEVVIYQTHQYVGKGWLWWSVLYHYVSLFGLLDIKQNKRCQVIDCRFTVDLQADTKLKVKINDFVDGGKFVTIEENPSVKEIVNITYHDKEAQKKHKKMKKVKTWMTILTIVAAVLIGIFVF